MVEIYITLPQVNYSQFLDNISSSPWARWSNMWHKIPPIRNGFIMILMSPSLMCFLLFSAPGGDFQSVLDEDMVPFEEDVQGFLRQILEALEFIHDRSIAHLDIKVHSFIHCRMRKESFYFMYSRMCGPHTNNKPPHQLRKKPNMIHKKNHENPSRQPGFKTQ